MYLLFFTPAFTRPNLPFLKKILKMRPHEDASHQDKESTWLRAVPTNKLILLEIIMC